MFRGSYEHQINKQGRVSLPAKFRQVLEEHYSRKLVLVGSEDKLVAYPEEAYRKKEEEDMNLPADDSRIEEYLLESYVDVAEVDVDGQGRILIPPKMRTEYGLEKEVIFIGVTNRILVYTPEQFAEARDRARRNKRDNSQLVAGMKGARTGKE